MVDPNDKMDVDKTTKPSPKKKQKKKRDRSAVEEESEQIDEKQEESEEPDRKRQRATSTPNTEAKKDTKRVKKDEESSMDQEMENIDSRGEKPSEGTSSNATEEPTRAPDAAATYSSGRAPKVSEIKMPSQRTPGRKFNETQVLDNIETPAKPPQPLMRLTLDENNASLTSSAATPSNSNEQREPTAGRLIEDQPSQQEGEEAVMAPNGLQGFNGDWRSWFLVFLVAQLLFFTIFFNPILSATENSSRQLAQFYAGMIYSSGTPKETKDERRARIERAGAEKEKMESLVANLLQKQEKLQKSRERVARELSALEQEYASLRSYMSGKGQTSRVDAEYFKATISYLDEVLQGDKKVDEETINILNEYLGSDSAYLLNLPALKLWKRDEGEAEPVCEARGVDNGLTESAARQSLYAVLQEVQAVQKGLLDSESAALSVVTWIQSVAGDRFDKPIAIEGASRPNIDGYPTLVEIREMISSELDSAAADSTGAVDYAALYHGASVIRTGPHSTSPSLVESMPVFNRLAAAMGIRFYGYGPEIALMPTYPLNSLGQCWSFLKDDNSAGKFATLSFRLARPIFVTSVSIEHVPRALNNKANAAIQKFHVIGFEGPNANEKSWNLGSFQYSAGEAGIQEFSVITQIDGKDVPAVQSLSLRIDSNWGATYSCLYRVRVHGEEEDGE